MLFIYIIAATLSTVLSYSMFVLLTMADVWTIEHAFAIFIFVCVMVGSAVSTLFLAKAAQSELIYWF